MEEKYNNSGTAASAPAIQAGFYSGITNLTQSNDVQLRGSKIYSFDLGDMSYPNLDDNQKYQLSVMSQILCEVYTDATSYEHGVEMTSADVAGKVTKSFKARSAVATEQGFDIKCIPANIISEKLLRVMNLAINHFRRLCKDMKYDTRPLAALKALPNQTIAELVLMTKTVCNISWTGRKDDCCMLAVYVEEGDDKGIYLGVRSTFTALVSEYKHSPSKKDVDEVICFLSAFAPMKEPNRNPDLIPFSNGILDYKTKELRPFSEDVVLTCKPSVRYVENPVSPHIIMPDGETWDFDSWIDTLSNDPELRHLIRLLIGAVLRPFVRWDKVVCLYSNVGMNGKGCIAELMRQLVGEKACASLKFTDFEKDSLVSQLLSAVAVVCDENDTNEYSKRLANLKAAVTGDAISIDRKYQNSITFKYSGLIVECVNALPRAADQTDSFYRRMLMIPFDKTFKGIERKYIKSDYLHRQDVLEYVAYSVMNMPSYYELPEPESCKMLLNNYKLVNDPILQFVDEIFPELVWNKVPQAFIYDLYQEWCRKNNPSGRLVGKITVLDKVKHYVETRYADIWQYSGDKTISYNKGDNTAPELLIKKYGLIDWANTSYKGSDAERWCSPIFRGTDKRVFVRIGGPFYSSDINANRVLVEN